jgi:L,D-peptidoglycan transpeptidase YkuD (ErfK/YbiS/YcfS/YnhG family)
MSTTNLTHHAFRVYAPNGTLLADMHNSINSVETLLHLDSTGEYTVFAGNADGIYTGTYTLFLQRINNPVNASVLPFGTTTNGSINQMAEYKTYTFSATAGDTTFIRMSTTNLTHHAFRVYAPNGTLIADFHYSINTVETLLHLDKTGEYTVFAGNADGIYTGTYTLYIQRISNPVSSRIGVFRNSTHMFYLDYNGNGVWNGASVDRSYNFGITGDIPITGDWNSDGISEIGIFRPSTHLFYLDYDGNGVWNGAAVDKTYNFGITGDMPITGDWNHNGADEIGVFRPSTHLFYLDYNGNGVWNGASVDKSYNFGISGDIPISGDWNSDGISEIGVFRPSTHLFYLDYNGNGVWNGASVDRQYNFGISGDIPISGDWNSDEISEIGVFRPSTHLFYLDYNGNGVWNGAAVDKTYNFGITGDLPISGGWN